MSKNTGHKWSVIALALLLCFVFPVASYAKTTQQLLEEAQQQKNETEEEKNEVEGDKNDLKNEQNSLKGTLDALSGDLTDIGDKLASIETQMDAKEAEIEVTRAALEAAREQKDEQYDAMKSRLQFMYESSNTMYLEMIFSAGSFADFVNAAMYIDSIASYDLQKLEEYEATVTLIDEQEQKLDTELAALDELKVQAEEEKGKVAGLISQTSNNIAQYGDQIADLEAQINAYDAALAEQEKDIAALKKQLAAEMAQSNLAANSSWRDISEVTFEEGDRYLLANLIYCEAGGEPYDGQVAVGAVVMNRVLSSVFPDTVVGVIYANRQFSPVASGRLALALAENRATESCYRAADEAMTGYTNVGGCVFFRTPIDGLTGINIGGHVFY